MIEALWAAGFFDGEGHASATRGGYPQFMISQRQREPLERFRDAVGVGKIYETELRGKPLYHYCAASIETCARVSSIIGPHVCSVKGRQIDEMWRRFREMRKTVVPARSEEARAKRSEHMKIVVASGAAHSPKANAKRSKSLKAFYSTPEGHKLASDRAHRRWNPEGNGE